MAAEMAAVGQRRLREPIATGTISALTASALRDIGASRTAL
jgi:hypothetical protein